MKKIFLVEDDADIRELIKFLLVDLKYQVQAFPTAEAFNERILSFKPNLILLDIRLPDGNGADICAKLKSQETTSAIPVILMSAHIDREMLGNSSADDFISKPFDINELTDKIKYHLT